MNNIHSLAAVLFNLIPILDREFVHPIDQKFRNIINPSQLLILKILCIQEFSMTDLAFACGMSKQQLTPLIKKMDRQHFIERKYIPEDRRIIRIAITDTGRNMLEEIHKYTVQILEEKLSALEEKDRQKLSVSLTSVYEIFSRENIFK